MLYPRRAASSGSYEIVRRRARQNQWSRPTAPYNAVVTRMSDQETHRMDPTRSASISSAPCGSLLITRMEAAAATA